MAYTAEISFIPAHWNRTAMAHIPARWAIDLRDFHLSRDAATRAEAIADMVAALRERGLTGSLRVVRI